MNLVTNLRLYDKIRIEVNNTIPENCFLFGEFFVDLNEGKIFRYERKVIDFDTSNLSTIKQFLTSKKTADDLNVK